LPHLKFQDGESLEILYNADNGQSATMKELSYKTTQQTLKTGLQDL